MSSLTALEVRSSQPTSVAGGCWRGAVSSGGSRGEPGSFLQLLEALAFSHPNLLLPLHLLRLSPARLPPLRILVITLGSPDNLGSASPAQDL